MRRFMIFGALGLIFVAFLFYVVNDIKSARPAIVHLKPAVAEGGDRDGEVTTTDKYVTVETAKHGKEIFTWDQILYISEKDLSSSRRLDRVVDLVDLLSKFGLVATVLFFLIGLYQYGQTQKWEREKFLAAAVKEFDDSKRVRNAKQMIDSLAQYPAGRQIDLLEGDKYEDRRVFVSNNEIYSALTTTSEKLGGLNDRAVIIRECFDDFLSGLVMFCHYVDQNLITKDALKAHLGYWIYLLGPNGKLAAKYKYRVLSYADEYMGQYVENLLRKYDKDFDWKTLKQE
ncbi:MAG: hypothetical protein H7Z16_12925 [Pyrinomonadaceae bacterium]|nr:hypothetical protein [Pyrinomonadaceae bacterium]